MLCAPECMRGNEETFPRRSYNTRVLCLTHGLHLLALLTPSSSFQPVGSQTMHCVEGGFSLHECVLAHLLLRTPKILEPAPLCIVLKMSHVLDQKTPLFRLVNKLFYMNSLFDYSFLNTHSLCCLLTGRPTPSSSIYISHNCLPILFSWLLHILIHPSIIPLAINIVLKLTAACVQSP